jgi:hypothetical protein
MVKTGWLCVMIVAASNLPAQETFVRSDIDQRGRLHVVTSQGRELVPALEKEQVGFEKVAISQDRRTVGWLATFPNCCTTYPVALKLVVRRGGRERTFTGNDLAFSRWAFSDAGTRVAFEQETVHGGLGVHYELRDVSTGRLVASFDPGGRAAAGPPAWVRNLDAVRDADVPAVPAAGSLPRTGLAVRDSAGDWCAEFVRDSLAPALQGGRRVALVFAGPAAVPYLRARVAGAHPGQCPAEFPQPRWVDYDAYRLELVERPVTTGEIPGVALVVASEVAWVRGADGVVRADLDGDGVSEEARSCLADEGQHLTLWSPGPGGTRARRWHEYFDWGAFTKGTCAAGEDGRGPPGT